MSARGKKSPRKWGECKECGECLARCRYLNFSREDAVREIRNLNAGRLTKVHERCISCYACDAFCPENARPYERILRAWNERYVDCGLPERARYLMPTLRPNFRQDVRYSREERALHAKWASDAPPARTVLYPGCNLLTMPLLAGGEIFEELPVWGRWDLCCGEMYFRMGLREPVERTAERLTAFYKDKKLDEMVFICPACYNMFTHVLPEQFGARFNFKTAHFVDWFTERLDRGVFRPKQALKGSVVMHDSCHARVLGGDFMERQRALLRRLGLTVRETPKNRADGLCCGMAAGCTAYSGIDMLKSSLKGLTALDRAPGDEIAMYCTGCLLTLSIARFSRPLGKEMRHTLELVRRALGERAPHTNLSRASAVVRGIIRHAVPVYFSRRRFRI